MTLVSCLPSFLTVNLAIITEYKNILYKTSNAKVGECAHMLQKNGPFGRACQFSINLAKAGNYNNNGLNCTLERERFVDSSKDWMLKN